MRLMRERAGSLSMSPPSMQVMRARFTLYRIIREYFAQRGVLEVETPILARSGNTDPAIDSFVTFDAHGEPLWLRTSPEFFHKRMLSAGSGDIFEIAKVFRRGEVSARHRPEFSMLEFYRLGLDEFALIDDLSSLISTIFRGFGANAPAVVCLSYCAWFERDAGFNPLTIATATLRARVAELGVITPAGADFSRDECLDLIRTHGLEALLPADQLSYIYDFPASQAALAQLNSDGKTARRFELFIGGFELANGYFELTDAAEQTQRFARDCAVRAERSLPAVALDQALLLALRHGLPSCAGVAVGLDRLLMLLLGVRDISEI